MFSFRLRIGMAVACLVLVILLLFLTDDYKLVLLAAALLWLMRKSFCDVFLFCIEDVDWASKLILLEAVSPNLAGSRVGSWYSWPRFA